MVIVRAIGAAIAMFSAIPMSAIEWDDRTLRSMLWAFPIVGGLCAGAEWVIAYLPLPHLLRATAFLLAPIVITGGIHLDGYLDTADALASQGTPEERQRILHDPHSGAFALIRLLVLGLAAESLCLTLEPTVDALCCLSAAFVLSRALSAWSVEMTPLSAGSTLARTFVEHADRRHLSYWSAAIAGCAIAVQAVFAGWVGALVAGAALIVTAWCRRAARVKFGGLSGDLCGWLVVKCEFWSLATFVLLQWWFL